MDIIVEAERSVAIQRKLNRHLHSFTILSCDLHRRIERRREREEEDRERGVLGSHRGRY